jgi:glycosidase
VKSGAVVFSPGLLKEREFTSQARVFRYLDVHDDWQEMDLPKNSLAFTWCQTPVIMRLDEQGAPLTIRWRDKQAQALESPVLPPAASAELFGRSGRIVRLELTVGPERLFPE